MVKSLKPSQQVVTSCMCQGLILGPMLFNVFFNKLDDGPECTFSRFEDDTKFGGVTEMLESSSTEGPQQTADMSWRNDTTKKNAQSCTWDRITKSSRIG